MDIRKNDCGCFFLLLELPLQGALSVNALYPQGDALGYGELPLWVGCSKFRYKSDTKSARIQLVKLLIFNTLYCKIVL